MSAQTATREQVIARWERNRARGRRAFIWRRGVFGWGLPAAALTIVYRVFQEQGWQWSLEMSQPLRNGIVVALLVFPLCGWLFGRWLWDVGEEQYDRLQNESSPPRKAP